MWNETQKAASMLDKIDPDWYKEINTDLLDMNVCTQCVIGQSTGNYSVLVQNNGYYELYINYRQVFNPAYSWDCFRVEVEEAIELLKKYWTRLIEIRRSK